ncbi:MAG: hypothetical protein KDD73_12095 [Anaerolineales bacterium]|nr:hypothetical protein [Anaerolineales bacterium]MCB9127117.1 hypothetical protein [Ardenticatenales bacterium]
MSTTLSAFATVPRWPVLFLTVVLLSLLAMARPLSLHAAPPIEVASGQPLPDSCQEGVLPSGALWLICVPASDWNGDVVLWAHGYTAFNEPLGFQNLYLGSLYLPDVVQALGYAFATTSYRVNGLAILEGADDMRELVAAFPAVAGQAPDHTFLTGASEGGIISTLLAEQSPELFDGALALCGPVGNFRAQINYFGDGRVLFDYYFPGVLPGSPINIPNFVINNWETIYLPAVQQAIANDPQAALELVQVARAAYDPNDFSTVENTVETIAWYSVFATNDANAKLNGNAFGNQRRIYSGSSNDPLLNQSVQRIAPDLSTFLTVPQYQTSGNLTIPVVNMHTTLDEQIPYWHQLLYRAKVNAAGAGDNLTTIPIARYGHCDFTPFEALGAFALLVYQSTGDVPDGLTMLDIDALNAEAAASNTEIPAYALGAER